MVNMLTLLCRINELAHKAYLHWGGSSIILLHNLFFKSIRILSELLNHPKHQMFMYAIIWLNEHSTEIIEKMGVIITYTGSTQITTFTKTLKQS